MPWGRLDDTFYDHPKTVEAVRLGGLAAIGLHVMAWSYSNRHGTNGFIADGWVGRRTRLAEALVNARKEPGGEGMWERVEGGYMIHDFLEFNLSAEDVKAAKETQHASRVAGGVARASKAERYKGRFAPADTPAGHQQEDQQTTSSPPAPSHTQPLPIPSPVPIQEQRVSPPTPPSGNGPTVQTDVARLVDLYRSFPAIVPSDQDGGVIAGMVAKHGAAHVEAVLRDVDTAIGASKNPLQYLAGACRKPRRRESTLEERAAATAERIRRWEEHKT